MTKEKLYYRYDLHDERDMNVETLEQMKYWLCGWWNRHPDEEMTDMEHDKLLKGIMNSDEDELHDRMLGIDFCFEDYEG